MKRNLQYVSGGFLKFALLLSLSGCNTLELDVPGPLIESPEIGAASGQLSLGLGVDDATSFTYTTDASLRPPNLNAAEIKKSAYLFGRGGYAVTEWFEIGGRLMPGSVQSAFIGGAGLTARAQLVGVGPGPGLKLSVYGGLFGAQTNVSGDQNGTFGPGGHTWKAQARALVSTAGTSIGYRFPEGPLLYVAGSYADQKVSGSIDHDRSNDGLSPAASYTLSDIHGSTRTAALGARFGEKVQLGLEVRAINRSWPGLSTPETRGGGESTEGVYALSLHFR